MSKEFAKAFYNSKVWKDCRKSYIAERINIDGGMCETCHEQLGYIVHHITELTPSNIQDPNIALSHSNLKYECKDCHDREENHFIRKNHDSTYCTFDEHGQPIPPILKIAGSF